MKRFNLFVVGHSHIGALLRLVRTGMPILPDGRTFDKAGIAHIRFLPILSNEFSPHIRLVKDEVVFNENLAAALDLFLSRSEIEANSGIAAFGRYDPNAQDCMLSFIGGNGHNLVGLIQHAAPYDFFLSDEPGIGVEPHAEIVSEASAADLLKRRNEHHLAVLNEIAARTEMPIFQVAGPPVIESGEEIAAFLPPSLRPKDGDARVSPSSLRYKLWRVDAKIYAAECERLGLGFLLPPIEATDNGFLKREFRSSGDSIHANGEYAKLLMRDFLSKPIPIKNRHPYQSLPDSFFWRRAVAKPAMADVDPVIDFPFKITKKDRIVTAGSCFAQEIARHLSASGFNFHVTERPHPIVSAAEASRQQYGVYSARYGNIYTARQLVQMFDRAFARFTPIETCWWHDGRYVDAFRPTIPPEGFASEDEMLSARSKHLDSVRAAFSEADVFVFTLGLTEAFEDRRDGAIFPVCPGTHGGVFDSDKYAFVNFEVDDVVADLRAFLDRVSQVNPNARVILTVSPVPLVATASGQHVLTATTYSKSVLRVAAQRMADTHSNVAYFPSYEIVTGNHARGTYFSSDLRSVTREGVEHVMKLFMRHATQGVENTSQAAQPQMVIANDDDAIDRLMKVICEEELLDANG